MPFPQKIHIDNPPFAPRSQIKPVYTLGPDVWSTVYFLLLDFCVGNLSASIFGIIESQSSRSA